MSSNNFINQTDPTAPLNLDNIDIREQYTKLTESEKTMVAAKVLGMNHVPVDILTFLYFINHRG